MKKIERRVELRIKKLTHDEQVEAKRVIEAREIDTLRHLLHKV